MNKLNTANFSQMEMDELQDINGGIAAELLVIAIYAGMYGFARGMRAAREESGYTQE